MVQSPWIWRETNIFSFFFVLRKSHIIVIIINILCYDVAFPFYINVLKENVTLLVRTVLKF